MKDEKGMEHCECGYHHGMFGGKHLYMLIGTLAVVYGLVNYLRVAYSWPPYMGWIVGGVLLIIIGWIKKYWMMSKMK